MQNSPFEVYPQEPSEEHFKKATNIVLDDVEKLLLFLDIEDLLDTYLAWQAPRIVELAEQFLAQDNLASADNAADSAILED